MGKNNINNISQKESGFKNIQPINITKDKIIFKNETNYQLNFLTDNFINFTYSNNIYLTKEMSKYSKIYLTIVKDPKNQNYLFKTNDLINFAFSIKPINNDLYILIYANLNEREKLTNRLSKALVFAAYISNNQEKTYAENEKQVRNIFLKNSSSIKFFNL